MKRKIYTCLTAGMLVASCLLSIHSKAQNQLYWRENFDADGPNADPAAANAVVDYAGTSGLWKFYGVWITTGTGCSDIGTVGSNRHIRSTSNSGVIDTVYVITPKVDFGINELRWVRSRANRRISVYKTTDTSATTTNWVLAYVQAKSAGIPVALCQDTSIVINDASAKRLMIKFEKAQNNDLDSIGLTSVNIITPVKFNTINAQRTAGLVKINWSILTEENTQQYDIERSTDGRQFIVIGSTRATKAGNYNWIDNAPAAGDNFYRIKGVDKDGAITYSTIVRIGSGTKNTELVISPNPIQGNVLNLQLGNTEKGTYSFKLYNNAGAMVFSTTLLTENGSFSKSVELPAAITKGIYQLQLINGTTRLSKAIIIQ